MSDPGDLALLQEEKLTAPEKKPKENGDIIRRISACVEKKIMK